MALTNSSPTPIDNDAAVAGIREYATQKRKCDEEGGVLRSILKRLKAQGVNITSVKRTVAAGKLDPEEVRAQMRSDLHYMALRNMPVHQDDLFDNFDLRMTSKTEEAESEWEAGDAGYRAGRNGVPMQDAPFEPGTALHVNWLQGWHQGQAAIAREMGDDVMTAPLSRQTHARARPDDADTAADDAEALADIEATPARRGRGRPRSDSPKKPRRARASAVPESAAAD